MELPTLTPEAILWLAGPVVASIAVAVGGVLARRRAVRATLFVIASAGFTASLLWILLVLRVEAIEQRSLGLS